MLGTRVWWRTACTFVLLAMGWAMPARVLFAQRELEAAGAAVIAVIVLFFLLFMGAVYAYFALALSTIARKTHTPNTWLAWIPIANLILMINIAQKPVWWILLLFVPFVNLAIMVIVWMGIAKARGRPDWWGLFILAPIANFILPGVLAWTD